MPNPLVSVALTGTDYTTAATISDVFGDNSGNNGGGSFQITGGNVYYSVQYAPYQQRGVPRSGYGIASWTADAPLGPGTGTIPTNAIGVKFKNIDGTIPATVSAYIAPPGQPSLGLSAPGDVTATTTTSMITGVIPATGTTPTAGSGFTYTHTNGTGVYVFTFTKPMAAAPLVVATIGPVTLASSANRGVLITAASTTGFTATTFSPSAGTAGDNAFMFSAQAVV